MYPYTSFDLDGCHPISQQRLSGRRLTLSRRAVSGAVKSEK
jgi:hypothetical protein